MALDSASSVIMPEIARSIDALYDAWRDAFARRDVEAVLDLLTPDYLLLAPNLPAMNRDALRPRLVAALDAYEVTPDFDREERIASGDLVFERGWDVQTLTPRAGGESRTIRQRVFLILRRGEDGQWRFARGMSQPEPAPAPRPR
jgi:uncharacterized protein (TIGR02246 family)